MREVEEPFREGQKGSSAMPHKRNPITCERIAGLARLLRGYAQAGLENVALWHERDISHSSVERVALPDATTLLHYMQHLMSRVVEGLRVHPDRMRENLELTHGALFSQGVLNALVESGMTRDDAYRIVQANAQRAWDEGRPFRELLEQEAEVTQRLDAGRLDELFDYARFVRHEPEILKRLEALISPGTQITNTVLDPDSARALQPVGVSPPREIPIGARTPLEECFPSMGPLPVVRETIPEELSWTRLRSARSTAWIAPPLHPLLASDECPKPPPN